MEEIVLYIILYLIVYFFYLFLVVLNKKKLDRYQSSMEVKYLKAMYKLDIEKHNLKKLSNTVAHANAFIISTTVTIISLISSFILKMVVGFLILIPLQLLVYHLMGKIYKRKEGI